jgi:apolipoprotein D and lipocalin family protein
MMRYLYKYLIFILLFLMFGCATTYKNANPRLAKRRVVAMTDFKADKYLGKWYEISRLPTSFEDKCLPPISAEYKADGDDISVTNTCRIADNTYSVANGMGYFTESRNIGKLKVTFMPSWLRFTHLARGDYWILYTDYNYAVVGSPDHEYLWILSRSEMFDPDKVAELINFARAEGFNTLKLKFNYVNNNQGQRIN